MLTHAHRSCVHVCVHQVTSGNGILKTVGLSLSPEAMYSDMMNLCVYLAVSIALAYIVLAVFVRESR
jgi:hypothetical protein